MLIYQLLPSRKKGQGSAAGLFADYQSDTPSRSSRRMPAVQEQPEDDIDPQTPP